MEPTSEKKTDAFRKLSRWRTELMGVLALYILIFHCWIPLFPGHRFIGVIEAAIVRAGFLGVDAFLFLSGMGLVFAIQKESLPEFYRKRFLRLLPPFFCVGILRALDEGWTLADFVWKVSGAAFLFEDIHVFLWFVPAIFLLYLFYPLYARGMRRSGMPVRYTAVCIGIWFVLTRIFAGTPRVDVWGFTNRIPVFMLGVLTGELGKEKKLLFTWKTYAALAVLLIIGAVLFYETGWNSLQLLVPYSHIFLPACMIVIPGCFLISAAMDWIASRENRLVRVLSGCGMKYLRLTGKVSLEMYCLQQWTWAKILIFFTGFSYTIIDPAVILINTGLAWLMRFLLYYIIPKTVRYFYKDKKV